MTGIEEQAKPFFIRAKANEKTLKNFERENRGRE
jgi:hypothetical protein